MNFSIVSGNPTGDECAAIEEAVTIHLRTRKTPVVKRSVFGLPQLRQPLPHQITFGARRES
ncbi:MAG: hypothetical protein F2814_01685 [Actinobacteria bacterium]|nr:hypothetical protein [Actinomycetota bacterium]